MSGDVINKDKPVLGYWKIRGLAQPIRLLLAYAGQEWEDKFYPDGSPPLFDQTEWLKDKFSFDMGYPNMPYYMEGNLKVANSGAIMRYLGDKFSLLGATPDAMAMADMAYFELDDWRMQFLALFYIYYGEEDATERFLKMVQPMYLSRFARLLRDGREYIVGQEITYSDFLLYEMLEWSLFLDPKGLRTYSGLETFRRRIAELPEIKAYLESDRFIAWPLVGLKARFGSNREDQRRRITYLRLNSVF